MAVAAVPYTLRHSPRSRRLRITIDPDLGLVVTVPPPTRRGWARPEARITAFLAERDAWIRRYLDSLVRDRAELAARGGLRDGALIRYRGELHRLRIVSGRGRRSTVARVGGEDGDELVVTTAGRDREATADRIARVLEEWLRDRARVAIDEAVVRHAAGAGRPAPSRRPARPTQPLGKRLARGPPDAQLAADPGAAGGARDGGRA